MPDRSLAPARSLFPSHPFPVSSPPHTPRRFSQLIFPCGLGSSCPIVIIRSAPCRHRSHSFRLSSRPAGSGAGRCHPLVSSARCGQASRRAGVVMSSGVLVSWREWRALRYGGTSSSVPWQASRLMGLYRPCRPCGLNSHRRASRLIISNGGASSSMPWCKQAGNGGGAMSSSLRLVRPSRGGRLVSSTLVRRDVGRGVAPVVARAVMWQASRRRQVHVGYAGPSRLCPFSEHQFDIRIPWGRSSSSCPCLALVN